MDLQIKTANYQEESAVRQWPVDRLMFFIDCYCLIRDAYAMAVVWRRCSNCYADDYR